MKYKMHFFCKIIWHIANYFVTLQWFLKETIKSMFNKLNFCIMNVSSYQKQLCTLLKKVSSEYSQLIPKHKELFDECATHYFTVIPPIIRTDIEILNDLKEMVRLYID